MPTKEMIDALEAEVNAYYMQSEKISFEIENRQEELTGIRDAYDGLQTAASQVLRQYFLKEGKL